MYNSLLKSQLRKVSFPTGKNMLTRHSYYYHVIKHHTDNRRNSYFNDFDNFFIPSDQNLNMNEPLDDFDYKNEQNRGENYRNSHKFNVYLLIAAGIMSWACFFLVYSNLKPSERIESQMRTGSVSYVGKKLIGGPWTLKATNGKPFSHKNLEGKYYLIYFGFTRCPDVCPMSLSNIAKAVKEIKAIHEYKYFDLEVVFVSVDPDRDSLKRIRKYIKLFDKNIIGVTGESNDDPNLKDIMKKFKIHVSKIKLSHEEQINDNETLKRNAAYVVNRLGEKDEVVENNVKDMRYSMDHTIITYLMGPENEFLTYLSANLTPKEIKEKLLNEIMHELYSKRHPKTKAAMI